MTTTRPCENCSVRRIDCEDRCQLYIPDGTPYHADLAAAQAEAEEQHAAVLRNQYCEVYVVPLHNDYAGEEPAPGGLDWFLGRGWELV
jgi:hypothetical protein